MKNFPAYFFYFSLCAAFLANAWFLAGGLFAALKAGGWRKDLVPALLLAGALACGFLFSGGVSPRGGYDN
jgi:hypothetical protein